LVECLSSRFRPHRDATSEPTGFGNAEPPNTPHDAERESKSRFSFLLCSHGSGILSRVSPRTRPRESQQLSKHLFTLSVDIDVSAAILKAREDFSSLAEFHDEEITQFSVMPMSRCDSSWHVSSAAFQSRRTNHYGLQLKESGGFESV
jgi:hypothetical protein